MKGKKALNIGLAPGELNFTGDKKLDNVQVHVVKYNAKRLEEANSIELENLCNYSLSKSDCHWVDIRGIHNVEFIESLGNASQIHPLVLADVLDVHQRPKYEEINQNIFLLLKYINFNPVNKILEFEHVCLYLSGSLLLSFQEDETDVFKTVRSRIGTGIGRITSRKVDYLFFALIDSLIDNYFIVIDDIESQIEYIEDSVIQNPQQNNKEAIHELRKLVISLRKQVVPIRESLTKFNQSDNPIIEDSTKIFSRSLFNNVVQILDMIDTQRDLLNGLQDLYLSEVSFRMNRVMQVLTVITTIFVPLSFLVGLYGMNFNNMPELHYKYGYFILLFVLLVIVITLLMAFRRNKWI